ncbi:TPA_asm: LO1a [Leatherback sea turtle adomavirus]|nr:TPA_asm: LO1a [Leatherback sea turtle adomavirus]
MHFTPLYCGPYVNVDVVPTPADKHIVMKSEKHCTRVVFGDGHMLPRPRGEGPAAKFQKLLFDDMNPEDRAEPSHPYVQPHQKYCMFCLSKKDRALHSLSTVFHGSAERRNCLRPVFHYAQLPALMVQFRDLNRQREEGFAVDDLVGRLTWESQIFQQHYLCEPFLFQFVLMAKYPGMRRDDIRLAVRPRRTAGCR